LSSTISAISRNPRPPISVHTHVTLRDDESMGALTASIAGERAALYAALSDTTACVSLLVRVATRSWPEMRRPGDRDRHADQTAVVSLDLAAIMTRL
jgi:hypothetical protein